MTTKPTVDSVTAILAAAGFDRGISNPPGKAQAGYAVITNRPDDGIILVNWWPERDAFPTSEAEEAEHDLWLDRYAAAFADAGLTVGRGSYGAGRRPAMRADYLTVSATPEEPTP